MTMKRSEIMITMSYTCILRSVKTRNEEWIHWMAKTALEKLSLWFDSTNGERGNASACHGPELKKTWSHGLDPLYMPSGNST